MEAEPSNPPEVYKNAAGFAPPVVTTTVSAGGRTYVNLDSKNWQGGTTTVVTPSSAAPLFAEPTLTWTVKIGRAEPPPLSPR